MGKGWSSAHWLLGDWAARLLYVFWGSLVAVDLATVLHASRWFAVVSVVLVVAAGCVRQGALTALAAAGMGWLFVNGFVENGLGTLHWRGNGDLLVLLLLVVVAESVAAGSGIDGFLTRTPTGSRSAWVRSKREARSPVRLGQ